MPDSSPIPAMKALTIRQPWASLIAAGVKTIETRSWSTRYRGPLAIHAGKHKPQRGPDDGCGIPVGHDWLPVEHFDGSWVLEHYARGEHGAPDDIPLPLGAVVVTCTLADVVPICESVSPPNHWPHGDLPPQWIGVYDGGAFLHRRPFVYGSDGTYVTDQLPFGDFTPGRYAWLLEDITPCDPVPAKGRQGLWDWAGE